MARLTKEQLLALIERRLPDNDERRISPARIREVLRAVVESLSGDDPGS